MPPPHEPRVKTTTAIELASNSPRRRASCSTSGLANTVATPSKKTTVPNELSALGSFLTFSSMDIARPKRQKRTSNAAIPAPAQVPT
jgi:hypothetical protein